jgi:hypothetical protein
MRAKDFLHEARTGSLQDDVASSLPATYVIPALQNNDAYSQYRFGVALAAARGKKAREEEGATAFAPTSPWGENQIVISYGNADDFESIIDDALEMVGLKASDKKLISTPTSEETSDVDTLSPVAKK